MIKAVDKMSKRDRNKFYLKVKSSQNAGKFFGLLTKCP